MLMLLNQVNVSETGSATVVDSNSSVLSLFKANVFVKV